MAGREIKKIAVLGGGTMGAGIAQVAAMAEYEVTLHDIDPKILEAALKKVRANLDKGIEKGKVTEELRSATLSRIRTAADLRSAVQGVDLVVEAVPERMELKKRLFGEVSVVVMDGTILASNTSSLSLTEIAAATKSPDHVVGMHFFNPPHIVKLLELVRAEQTSEEVLALVLGAAEKMGRKIITVRDSPGFATSRLGVVLGLEAMRMLEQGVADAADIDKAMELGYGHSMGPLRVTDLVGLDVRLAIAEYLHAELGQDQYRPPLILRQLVRAGKLGKKTGEGFFRWDA